MEDVTAELEKIERHLKRNYTNYVLKTQELNDWHNLSSIDPVNKQQKVMEFQILNQEMMKLLARQGALRYGPRSKSCLFPFNFFVQL
jgi:hypothetical protein